MARQGLSSARRSSALCSSSVTVGRMMPAAMRSSRMLTAQPPVVNGVSSAMLGTCTAPTRSSFVRRYRSYSECLMVPRSG